MQRRLNANNVLATKIVQSLDGGIVDKLKGLAICIIVFYHIKSFSVQLEFLCKEFALPLFFFLSGFLYFKYSRKKYSNYWVFVKDKAKRLLVPYIIMGGGI